MPGSYPVGADGSHRHLGSPYGKTEAWILLDTPDDGAEPAYAGIGFVPGVTREGFAGLVRARDSAALRRTLHRTEVHPGEVYVAHAGVPHYLGPGLSFIEVQEPSDHIVIPETSGADDDGATMGLGWELALDMIDYGGAGSPGRDAAATFARARQQPRELRVSGGRGSPRCACWATTSRSSSTPPRWRWRTSSRSPTAASRSRSWWPGGWAEGESG